MTNKERTYSDEEVEKNVAKELPDVISKIFDDFHVIEKAFIDNEYFNPNTTAEIFGQEDMSLEEYFESKIKNLSHAITFITKPSFKSDLNEQYEVLSRKFNKLFKPEKFIIQSVEYIMDLSNKAERAMRSRDIDELISFSLAHLESAILGINSYLERVRRIQIDQVTEKKIREINKQLEKFNLPVIEV